MNGEFADIEEYETEPDEAAWHRWYTLHLGTLDQAIAPVRVTVVRGSWQRLARPLAMLVPGGSGPMEPTNVVAGESGGWYILAPSEPKLADGAMWVLRTEEERGTGRLLRDQLPRGRLRRVYDPLHPERTTRGVVSLHGSRRYGFSSRTGRRLRSGPQADGRATLRALAVLGMMETAGMTHGAALRTWALWPESSVPAELRNVLERITHRGRGSRHLPQAERDDRRADRETWSAWERGLRLEHRRIWRSQGLAAADGRPTGITIVYAP